MIRKLLIWIAFAAILYGLQGLVYDSGLMEYNRDLALKQLENSDAAAIAVRQAHRIQTYVFQGGVIIWLLAGLFYFRKEMSSMFGKIKNLLMVGCILSIISFTGCVRPFEPIQLESIGTNEEGFLIPYTGDITKQTSLNNEEFLAKNLIATKQVRIPQQWVQKGYEWLGANGVWQPAAILIKVDKAPVTREWTADENTGTSNKKEAIWVMTADQVEFSTGWTCTARIASKEDSIKFLHNYPNGSLVAVLDTEVRARIQALFGMEVTDLPMDELRKNATPHLTAVITKVDEFFKERGITITNLGISGGFVYKNPSIQEKLVEVFNSEQEKNIMIARTQAQEEHNKQITLEATGKATAILTERKAEAEGIKAVADAKAYELEKAVKDLPTYLALKKLEVEVKKTEKWNGIFPATFFGGGQTPEMLLNVPVPGAK